MEPVHLIASNARPGEDGNVPAVREQLRRYGPAAGDRARRWEDRFEHHDARGVRIALIDAGCTWTIPAFRDVSMECRDFTGSGSMIDTTGHGTKNLSILACRTRGAEDRPALAHGAHFLLAKALCADPRRIARAIAWAVDKDADVVILPFGRGWGAAVIDSVLAHADQRGCRIFGAAGNRGPNCLLYPAGHRSVIAVTASDREGNVLDWCCRAELANEVALGVVASPLARDEHDVVHGSSVACVIAGGLAALDLARRTDVEARRDDTVAD